jgi:hypothetical protein
LQVRRGFCRADEVFGQDGGNPVADAVLLHRGHVRV